MAELSLLKAITGELDAGVVDVAGNDIGDPGNTWSGLGEEGEGACPHVFVGYCCATSLGQ
jgi:hypothetical protein